MAEGAERKIDDALHGQAIREWFKQGLQNNQIVQRLRDTFGVETSEAAVRRATRRYGLKRQVASTKPPGQSKPERPGVTVKDGETVVISRPTTSKPSGLRDKETILRDANLDPAHFTLKLYTDNHWDGPSQEGPVTYYQSKVHAIPKVDLDLIVPARIPGDYIAPKPRRRMPADKPQLWVVAGDEQAIFHHVLLDELVNEFIAQERPHGYVGTGDLTDQNSVSRHKANAHERWNSPLQLDVNGGGRILRGRRMADEDMDIYWMPGNHDIRLGAQILAEIPAVHGLTAAQWDEMDEQKALMSLPNVLRLDELNINYVDPMGEYEHAQFKIGPHVAVRHGSRTGKNAALGTIDRLTHSVIIGHTHAQSIQHRTVWDIERNYRIITAVETGALCDFEQVVRDGQREKGQGLGYAVDPNWVNGFTTVVLWPDGSHHIENAVFNGEHLYWRGKRYG